MSLSGSALRKHERVLAVLINLNFDTFLQHRWNALLDMCV